MTDIHTEDRVATLHASMDDMAKLAGQQRQTINVLVGALKLIKSGEVEEYDEELRCTVLVPMDAEEASRIAHHALKATGEAT